MDLEGVVVVEKSSDTLAVSRPDGFFAEESAGADCSRGTMLVADRSEGARGDGETSSLLRY